MENINKIQHVTLLFLLLFFSSSIYAADGVQVEMAASLNPVGSGARAVGMGGAFISVADDATAASWNPAGLVQLEKPEVSAVYQYFIRKQSYESESHPEIEGSSSMNAGALNYASAALPFVLLNRNMIVSVNYQRLYELNKNIDFNYIYNVNVDKMNEKREFRQEGFLYALSPAFAVQITPQFYVGATLNLWGDYLGDNGWETTYKSIRTGILAGESFESTVDSKQNVKFKGVNANLGFLWSFHPRFTLGGVIKTPFDADIRWKERFYQSNNWTTLNEFSDSLRETEEDITIKMPMSYGLGLSYRRSDNLTLAFDIYRTDWSEYILKDKDGDKNPLDGRPIEEGRLKDTTQLRLGAEYLIIKDKYVIPVRCGMFYDPEPAKESLDDFYGFSAGVGFVKGRIALDAAYQYRTGNHVSGDLQAVKDSNADIHQHLLMTSAIFYF